MKNYFKKSCWLFLLSVRILISLNEDIPAVWTHGSDHQLRTHSTSPAAHMVCARHVARAEGVESGIHEPMVQKLRSPSDLKSGWKLAAHTKLSFLCHRQMTAGCINSWTTVLKECIHDISQVSIHKFSSRPKFAIQRTNITLEYTLLCLQRLK